MAEEPAERPRRRGLDDAYSNPEIPEGINVSPEHPLKEFAQLTAGVLGLVALAVLVVGWLGGIVGALLPFETERRLGEPIGEFLAAGYGAHPAQTQALQNIADRLATAQPLPDGMRVRLHYSADDTVNAFATVGGNLVIHRGLICALNSENALAMVIAHEMAHVRERHVVRSLGRGVLTSIVLATVTGGSDIGAGAGVVQQAGLTTSLVYSRDQEREADRLALANLASLYGHAAGATALFNALGDSHGKRYAPEWLATHPDTLRRIATVEAQAREAGWALDGALSPLTPTLGAVCRRS